MDKYQLNYAESRHQMYDKRSRNKKAKRLIKIIKDIYPQKKLKDLIVLDVGASTGIIDNYLSRDFKKTIGIDIDKKAISYANSKFRNKKLQFRVDDAMNLGFKDNSFDIVICAQVYEHVPDAQKMFNEIFRVLKPNGVCYLAALNKLWPWEPHYDLPFLSWLPKKYANYYVKLLNKSDNYYETTQTYWQLKKMVRKFKIIDYTPKILRNPTKFGFSNKIKILGLMPQLFKYMVPTLFWILVKKDY